MSAPHTAYTHPAAHTNPPPLRFVHRRLNLLLRTNDATVREFARMQFAPVVDASSRLYDHHAFIRSGTERLEVTFDGERLFEALIPQSPDGKAVAAYYAVRDCFTHAISCANDCVIYGASLTIAGTGVLLLGPPGCGKTLTAVHLCALSGELLGDDVAVLCSDGSLDAVPRTLSLRADRAALLPPGALSRLHSTPPLIGHGDCALYCIAPADCGIRQAQDPAPLRSVVFIDVDAAPGVRPVEPATAEALFARYRQRGKPHAIKKLRALRGVRAYYAGGEHPARLAQRLAEVLRCG
jgi:hypothetical protein